MADPGNTHGPSDEDLIDAVRQGVTSAYGELYIRHVDAARNLSRQLARTPIEADDLVSEAFARVLQVLRTGGGPDSAFRAYLLTSLRHTAYDRTRRERRVELAEDVGTVAGADLAVPFTDTAVAGLERSLAARAFARLPERWQTVLWHTEVEGQPPSAVAPILGLSANGVAALAYRAREGLRQAFLQEHLSEVGATSRCRAVAERLGAWTRGGLSRRETVQVETHLDGCERCRTLAAELADLNGALRGVAFVVLGVGAGGYLATAATSLTGAGAGAVTGSTAGAVSGPVNGGPRQWFGAAASATALAAAMVLGLLSGGSPPDPVARPAEPPASESLPLPEAPPDPPLVQDPVQLPPPPPPPSPPDAPPPAAPPPPPEEAPEPVGVRLETTVPDTSLVLVAGGDPVDLPITVRNTGDRASEPISVLLDLPKGVTATGRAVPVAPPVPRPANADPGGGTTGAPPTGPGPASEPGPRAAAEPPAPRAGDVPARPASPAPPPTAAGGGPDVCSPQPAGTRVTCRSTEGVPAGGSLTLHIRLAASVDAEGGALSGSLSAGADIHLRLATITVTVRPAAVDDLALAGSALRTPGGGWPGPAELRAEVTNTGTSTAAVSVDLRLPWWIRIDELPPRCALRRDAFRPPPSSWVTAPAALPASEVRCESAGPVPPGGRHDVRLRLHTWLPVEAPIGVKAALGGAREELDLRLTAARPALRVDALGRPEPLVPGGSAGPVTYRLRNTGNAPTGPLTVQARATGRFILAGAGNVGCDERGGLVRCRVPAGLEPGGEAVLPFAVRALEGAASPGRVTGHVLASDGELTRLPVVPVGLAARPSGVEISSVHGAAWSTPSPTGGHRSYHALLRVRVGNVGQTTAPVRLAARLPPDVRPCRPAGGPPAPPATAPLSPGSSRHLVLWLCAEGGREAPPPSAVTVVARLGDAEDSTSVRVEWSRRPAAGPPVGDAPDLVEDVDRNAPPAPPPGHGDAPEPDPDPPSREPAPPREPRGGPGSEPGDEHPSPPSPRPSAGAGSSPEPESPARAGRNARSAPLPPPPSLDSGVMRRLSDTFGRRTSEDRRSHPSTAAGRGHG